MRHFIDTEFSERGSQHPIELISIGIVAEDGREFYAENKVINLSQLSPWLLANVVPHLISADPDYIWNDVENSRVMWPQQMAEAIRLFIGDDPHPEFWGYYSAYDYVVLSQLMGGIEGWPQGWPFLCLDLRQWLDHEALYHIAQDDDAPHDALQDARWVRDTFMVHHWSTQEATL